MPTSQERKVATLPRLPPELVEEILVHAGVDACVALRHLSALRRVLAAYVHAGNYTSDCEKAMLKTLVGCHWSAGVQAMIDADIRHPFSRIVELDWNGIVLPASSIRKLYLCCFAAGCRDIAWELLAVLAMMEAAEACYLSVVKFLHEHGYPMCEWDDIKDSPEYIKEWWRSIRPSKSDPST
ncbi:hypothetical protein RI367_002841 [Sorochytrium milnesiophthora]